MTLNVTMTADARFLCGSWASYCIRRTSCGLSCLIIQTEGYFSQ